MALERASGGLAPLSSFMVGLITAATPCGAVFGALSGGVLADKYGRKPAVRPLSLVVFSVLKQECKR
jgi:MFS family permease